MKFDWCETNLNIGCGEYKYDHCEVCNIARAYQHGYETAQEDMSKTGWIPCSDRLPKNDGCMLVTIDDGIEFGKYEDGSWSIWVCEHWDKWDAKGTIAWMPLPEPYREEGKE